MAGAVYSVGNATLVFGRKARDRNASESNVIGVLMLSIEDDTIMQPRPELASLSGPDIR